MKLQDLAAPQRTKQVAKVMESYFGNSVSFDTISVKQASSMLDRVRGLLAEHRRQPNFHSSEQNPAYLKLVMMEQGLAGKIAEAGEAAAAAMTPQQQTAMAAQQQQQAKRQTQDQLKQIDAQIKQLQTQRVELQKQMSMPMAEGRQLTESEVQQAQVVLASQDMVDQVQKMIEQVTSMQFKDLPALVDQIKSQVGQEQATQFNTDATAALGGLVQNLQGSKQQLETALGVVTGQAPVVPGEEAGLDLDAGAELPPEGEEDLGAELDQLAADTEEEPAPRRAGLGRERR